jgi:hypothetical protein
MKELLTEALIWGLSVGITATAIVRILAYEEFFTGWWRFGARYEHRWFFKPLWGCSHCMAGQIALWSYLAFKIVPPAVRVLSLAGDFRARWPHYTFRGLVAAFGLFMAIGAAVFFAKTLTWIYERYKI